MWLAKLRRFLGILGRLVGALSYWHTAFSDAVAAVEPLLAGVGVHLGQVHRDHAHGNAADSVEGQSKYLQMRISTEDRLVFVEIAPLGDRAPLRMLSIRRGQRPVEHEGPVVPRYTDLSSILRAVAPDAQLVPRFVRSSKAMREEVERQVHLLLQHCRPMLEGDFSAWPAVVKSAQTMAGPAGGETIEAWVGEAKQMMSDALERKDYALVSALCLSLRMRRVDLTPEEMAACRLAARELEKQRRG